MEKFGLGAREKVNRDTEKVFLPLAAVEEKGCVNTVLTPIFLTLFSRRLPHGLWR